MSCLQVIVLSMAIVSSVYLLYRSNCLTVNLETIDQYEAEYRGQMVVTFEHLSTLQLLIWYFAIVEACKVALMKSEGLFK